MSIEIKQITKTYDSQKALDNVSFSIKQGELVGFLGPNGAGKSTLMKIITGYLSANSGEVWVNDVKVTVDEVKTKQQIGYLPENNPLYHDLYIREYLEITAGIYNIGNKKQRVAEIISLTGLEPEQHKKIGSLSKGYRQRVGLAQALIHNPPVLILDEPTTGLDPNQLGEIRALIASVSQHKTVLLSSHIMQEIEAICNRVVIINHGKLVADSPIDMLKAGNWKSAQQVKAGFLKPVQVEDLKKLVGVAHVEPLNNEFLITALAGADIRPVVFRFAAETENILLSMAEIKQNLENIFRQLTQD